MKKTYLTLLAFFAFCIWFQVTKPALVNNIKPAIVDLIKFPLVVSTRAAGAIYGFATLQNNYEKRIQTLEKKVVLLKRAAIGSKEVMEENERLRSLLVFKKRINHKSVAAQIIGKGSSGLESYCIIDKGYADGIVPNMTVAKEEGLLGRVIEAGRGVSKVMLIDDPNSKIGIIIQRTREQGVLIGAGDGMCKIAYLACNSDIKQGDIVITSELSSILPKGMLVGEIDKIFNTPHSLYVSAIVRPSCDLFKIEEVLCIE